MIIAHRFIGGFGILRMTKSVQRTAGAKCCKFTGLFSRPLHGLSNALWLLPALKRWAIVIQSASRTKKNTFAAKPSFVDELRELLNAAGIEFDEKYLW